MTALLPWIFDGIILIFLIVCIVRGAKRGLILALCSLLAVFVAFAGATVAAREFSPGLSAALQPRIQSMIEQKLQQEYEDTQSGNTPDAELPAPAVSGAPSETDTPDASVPPDSEGAPPTPSDSLSSILDAIRGLGIYEGVVEGIQSAVNSGFGQAAASVANAAAAELSRSIAYLVVFVLAFVLILLAWKLLSHALDLVARLPVLHTLNGLGGGLLGLVKGAVLLFVIAWVLQFFGKVIPEAVVEQTVLLHFFLNTNPLSLLSGF